MMLTIGQLAKQVGLRTSALRYYETQGLLKPDGRSDAGYRLYRQTAVERLRLIRRAQRLGFSLADIQTLLAGWDSGDLDNRQLTKTAMQRYLHLERQVTELLAVQHELAHFLQDLQQLRHERPLTEGEFSQLLAHVCNNAFIFARLFLSSTLENKSS